MPNQFSQQMVLIVGLVALGPARAATAKTWFVSKDSTAPPTTIQRAIELAQEGDSILVAPGTYNEDIDFLGKGVVLKSEAGPNVTILDGAGQDSSIVMFRREEPAAALLEGFTLKHGTGTRGTGPRDGGAILCNSGAPTIQGNIFTENEALFGGAIVVERAFEIPGSPRPSPTIRNNVFRANSAVLPGGGGAVCILGYAGTVTLAGNTFEANEAGNDGGGIMAFLNFGTLYISHNTFSHNVAGDQGGGVSIYADFAPTFSTIQFNVFVGNTASNRESGFGSGGGLALAYGGGTVDHNTFVDNTGAPESPCGGGALRLLHTGDVVIRDNIFADSHGCGVVCALDARAQFGPNLFWNNVAEDIATGSGNCPESWRAAAIFADPQFCVGNFNPYELARSSPAFAAGGSMGAFSEPGCAGVPVVATSWGSIKAMFR